MTEHPDPAPAAGDDAIVIPTPSGSDCLMMERHIKLFSNDMWELTQKWESLNNDSCEILARIINNRLRVMYGKISGDPRLVQDDIVRDAEKLSAAVVDFEALFKRFQKAQASIPAMRQFAANAGSLRIKAEEISDVFSGLVKMYEKELSFKKSSLIDLGAHDNSDVFTAILASWNLSVFIDRSDEIVVGLSELPDVKEMLELLNEERVPLIYWTKVARGYYIIQRYDDFVFLLEAATEKTANDGVNKDRLRCMDMLAAYYVRIGMKTKDDQKKRAYFGKATILYTTADKLMMYDSDHLIGRAYFCLVESQKWEQAKTQFEYVINLRANDVIAIIGMGLVCYASGNYNGALGFFKRALRYNPKLPAEVRLGLGHCFLKLQKYAKASSAFQRVLNLDPRNVPAKIALATCFFHDGGYDIAEQALRAVECNEPDNPVILNHLANVAFLRNKYDEAELLAWKAYEHTSSQTDNHNEIKALKAESAYIFGRCLHAKRDYDKAAKFYQLSVGFNDKFILGHFGLGQINLGRGNFEEAINSFEKVLAAYPNDCETLKILGSIYARWQGPVEDDKQRDARKKALEFLMKVHEKKPDDVEVILELAQLQESTRPDESLKKYQKALEMLESDPSFEIPAEMYSNIGALHHQLGNYTEAHAYYEKAKEIVLSSGDCSLEEIEAKVVTLDYNLGRLYEAIGRNDEAEETFESILSKRPGYTDALLRVGCIWRDRGDSMKAMNKFKDAIAIDTENPIPWIYIANLHVDKGETKLAQSSYEQVLKTNKNHPYAMVGLGNVWLDALYNVRSNEKDEKDKIKKFRDNAIGLFVAVLKKNPRNAWAANGIGCVLVHQGKIQDARDVFSQVREAAPDLADVFLNLAHIHMETKQYTIAAQMYKAFMKKHDKQFDIQLLQYVARACWKAGNYAEAKDFLQRAMLEAPDNLLVRYNMAIVLQSMAAMIIRDTKATIVQLEGAIDDLKEAERAFIYLVEQPDSVMAKFRYVSRTTCQKESRTCKDMLAQAKQFRESAWRNEAKVREQQEKLRAERLEQIRLKEEAEEEKRRKIEEQKEKLLEQRQAILEKTKEMLLKNAQRGEEKEGKKKSSGRRKKDKEAEDFVNDSSDMGDWQGEPGTEGAQKRKKEKKRKRRLEKGAGDASGSEGEEKRSRKRKKLKKKEDRQREREEELYRKGKIKSRAIVSTSSSEDSDNEPKPTQTQEEEAPPRPISSDDSISNDESEKKSAKSVSSKDSDSEKSDKSSDSISSDSDVPKAPVAKRARIIESDDSEDEPKATAAGSSEEDVVAPVSDSE